MAVARRAAGMVGLGVVAVLLTGCGIRPTPVVRAGDAPGGKDVLQGGEIVTGQSASPQAPPPADPRPGTVVYFLEEGRLRAVARPDQPAGRVSEPDFRGNLYTLALQQLFAGPLPQDTAAGLTTAIPGGADQDPVKVFQYEPKVQLFTSLPVEELSEAAAMLISCTVDRVSAAVFEENLSPPVTVVGDGRNRLLPRCPEQLVNARPA